MERHTCRPSADRRALRHLVGGDLPGLNLVVVTVPPDIQGMALVLVPAIVIGDAGALIARRFGR